MRIISLYYTHKPGGMCKRLYRLLNALASRNHEVIYLTLDNPPADSLDQVSVKLIPFPLEARRGLFFWALFTLWCPLWFLIQTVKLRPKRIVVFGAYYSGMTVLIRLLKPGIPVVLFLRSLVFKIDLITGKPGWLRAITALVDRLGMRLASKVVFMTEAMRSEAEGFLGRKIGVSEVLRNDLPAINHRDSKVGEEGSFNILTSGVLDQRKNVELLIEAVTLLPEEQQKKICVAIAGDGPLLEQLKVFCENKNPTAEVEFMGWQNCLEPLLAKADVVVHPSLHEGVPNSVLEALAVGVPVLVSDIPEHRELLEFDDLLFPLGEPQSLKEKLFKLCGSPAELSNLQNKSARAASKLRFDWDELASNAVTFEI